MPKRNLTKPATAKSSKPAKAVKPVTAVAATAPAKPVTATAKPARVAGPPAHITRTLATVAAQRTNYAELTARDGAYFTFYKRLANANGGKLTVAAIVASGQRPTYTGSCKPHDAGVIVRLTKAGLLAGNASDASPLTVTATGKSRA